MGVQGHPRAPQRGPKAGPPKASQNVPEVHGTRKDFKGGIHEQKLPISQTSGCYVLTFNRLGWSVLVTLATIPTVNPQIAAKFQDGVFTNAFENTMYNNGVSFSSIASTGYYDIDASIVINSGTARTAAKRVLYTPTLMYTIY